MVLDVAFPVLFPLFSFLKDKEDALTFITLWFDVEANIAARVLVQFYPPSRTTNSAVWPIFCFLTFYSFLPSFLFLYFFTTVEGRPGGGGLVCQHRLKKRPLVAPFSLLFFFRLGGGGAFLFSLSLSLFSFSFFFVRNHEKKGRQDTLKDPDNSYFNNR